MRVDRSVWRRLRTQALTLLAVLLAATALTFAVTADNVTSVAATGSITQLGSSRLAYSGDAPTSLADYDVQSTAYQRFLEGTWICGDPTDTDIHNINVNFWPTAIAGFYLRVESGADVDVALSIDTKSSFDDGTITNVPLLELTALSAAANDEWVWYQSEVVAMNTDVIGRPRLEVTGGVVDMDVIVVGPAPRGYRAVPAVEAWVVPDSRYDEADLEYDESIPYDRQTVVLGVLGAPEFSSARIDWGDNTVTEDVTWDTFSVSLQTHDYSSKIIQDEEQRFFITVKDLSDPLIAASTSIVIGEVVP